MVVFTGDGGIGVREFLRWIESWFATQGECFNGVSEPSKKKRVAQIHVACPIHSVAGGFLRSLLKDVLWNEEALTKALIEQFEDGEMDKQEQDDILTKMSVLLQGDHDVFTYSRQVLKLLRRQPTGLQHYNRILSRYYIDGLASEQLHEMVILTFLKADSGETPYQVVKGVMRLATQLKVKGYKGVSGRHRDHNWGDDDDDDDDMYGSSSMYDFDSDAKSERGDCPTSGRRKERQETGERSRRLR